MKRYYFYSLDYRKEHKQNKVISFELKALYAEKAFSNKVNKEVVSFKYFDKVKCKVKTNINALYYFSFDHGTDGCEGHSATSCKDLQNDLEQYSSFKLINEKNYMRLRRLAVKLMFRHTKYFDSSLANSEFYYSKQPGNFWDVHIIRMLPFQDDGSSTEEYKLWKKQNSIPEFTVSILERIDIFIAKPDTQGKQYQSFSFNLEANNKGINKYVSIQEAVESQFYHRECERVSLANYMRFRKFCILKIWNHYELEISKLKEKQNYSVRILDF